jgi:hypothetical protein
MTTRFRVAIKLTNSSSEKLAVWLSITLSVVVDTAVYPL